jgi:hypothetical protein
MTSLLETEIRYNDALQDIFEKEKRYSALCSKIKERELNYEYKVQELNLKMEQDKYINQLINQKTSLNSGSSSTSTKAAATKKF